MTILSLPKKIGQYELFEEIGRGGMGVVYKAYHKDLDLIRAIKIISPQAISTDNIRERFLQEARITANLKHQNAVEVHEILNLPSNIGLIMEYIDGESLDKIITRSYSDDGIDLQENDGEKLLINEEYAINITLQCLDALGFYHDQGVIHRDIKADNILVRIQANGKLQAKITDFGIAKIIKDSTEPQIHHSLPDKTIIGSPIYMAPELIDPERYGQYDHRVDLYSIGITLYYMLAGKPPFNYDDSYYNTLRSHLEERPAKIIRATNPIEPELQKIVFKSIEKNPDNRYQSAAKLSSALQNYFQQKQHTYSGETVSVHYKNLATPVKSGQKLRNLAIPFTIGAVIIILAFVSFWVIQKPQLVDSIPAQPIKLNPDETKEVLFKYDRSITKINLKPLSSDGHHSIRYNVEDTKVLIHITASSIEGDSQIKLQAYPELGFSVETPLTIITRKPFIPDRLKLIRPSSPVRFHFDCHRIISQPLEYNFPLKRVKLLSIDGNAYVGYPKVSINPENAKQVILQFESVTGKGISNFCIQVFPTKNTLISRKDWIKVIVRCW